MREFTLVKTCLNFLDELRPRDKLCKHTKLSVRRRKRLLKPPRRRQVALEAQVDATSFLEQGWFVTEGFTGLQVWSVAQPMNVRDGKDDSYHFPPYQYRDHDMLWTRKGASRRPTAQEREAIMGIPVGHTRPCLPKAQQGTMKGEDLMITAASEPQVKFHRLRSSVPAKLWRWKEVTGWRWRRSGEHINVLELRAILTSLRCGWLHIRSIQVRSVREG